MATVGNSRVTLSKSPKYRLVSLIAAFVLGVGCSDQAENLSDVEDQQPLSVERSVGFDGDIIRLGVIANLTGPGASLDRARLTGVSAYWSDVNALGGIGGRYAVELNIVDHSGNPGLVEELAPGLLDEVVSLAFINETALGAVHPFLVEGQVLGVVATSTLDWESDSRFLTHSPPIEAVALALFENAPLSKWCVVTDGSPLGVGLRRSAPQAAQIAAAQNVTLIGIEEDLASAVSAAACQHVLAEVSEEFQEKLISSLPPNRTVYRHAGLTDPTIERSDLQFSYIDSGPPWDVDSASGMRPFLAALLRHAPDAGADTRMRDGYVSQIRLHQLLEAAVKDGDLRRSSLFEAGQTHTRIQMLGLAEEIDMSLEEPPLPRNIHLQVKVNDDEGMDGRGWKLDQTLRPQNASALEIEIAN
ncbi:MAG: hypothetical protein CL458_08695 [Acidimicrobiaceae bacterium]|nr:hypothetical protein [Acidimicrobiaceae bacterium]|tara:strand:- start:8389 stop:9636 length:1248 start_codon:yes stop_codon:yes gene_type:complete